MKNIMKIFFVITVCLIVTFGSVFGSDEEKAERFTFVQLCDPQLGFGGYEHDVNSFKLAVRKINDLKPDFLLICGDLVQTFNEQSLADFNDIKAGLKVPCYCSPGNHDVENMPTVESLNKYRKYFGKDYFSFEHNGYTFVMTNTNIWETYVEGESQKQDLWIKQVLELARDKKSPVFIIGHHPLYANSHEEPDGHNSLPPAKRKELLELFKNSGVVAVLTAHTHQLVINDYKGIQLVTGETTSRNFDRRPLGFRLWSVSPDSIKHEFVPLVTETIAVNVANIDEKVELRRGNYHSEQAAKEELEEFSKTYTNLEQWKERAENIRNGILRGAELTSMPAKCSLNPIINSKRIYDGYTVENVAFQSLPGVYVAGNLYCPQDISKPCAAVLCTHGHGPDGRFGIDHQKRCATLAKMGAVVFSCSMVGYNDWKNEGWEHKIPKVLKFQLWNNIRTVDFLLSLDYVDSKRIGITGESGGGTQSFLLTAIDDRIAISIPTVMVSAYFFGGCECESGMPVHKSSTHVTNNVEIAALAAPRLMLIISDGKDWTKNTPEVEFPYIRNIYGLYNAEKNVENLHLANEGHDYGFSKRVGAYKFLAKHFGLSLNKVTNSDGSIDESFVVIETPEKMLVFNDEHPMPSHVTPNEIEGLPWK